MTDVTLVANYIAGNGGPCGKGLCGGGSLANQGATRLSYYYNLWERNLRRTPMVSGAGAIADVRYNVVRGTAQGGIQIGTARRRTSSATRSRATGDERLRSRCGADGRTSIGRRAT